MAPTDPPGPFQKLKIEPHSWISAFSSISTESSPLPSNAEPRPVITKAESRSAAIPISTPSSAIPFSRSSSKPIPVGHDSLIETHITAQKDVPLEGTSIARSWLNSGSSWSRPTSQRSSMGGEIAIGSVTTEGTELDLDSPNPNISAPLNNRTGQPSEFHSRRVNGLMSPLTSKEPLLVSTDIVPNRVTGIRSFSTNLYRQGVSSPTYESLQAPDASSSSNGNFGFRRSSTMEGMKSMTSYKGRSLRANSAVSPASLFLSKWSNGSQPVSQPQPDERGQSLIFSGVKYIIGDSAGRGGFSEIKKIHAIYGGDKVTMAAKVVKKKTSNSTDLENNRVQAEIEHEISIWRFLKHKHILPLHEVQDTDYAFFCLTEYFAGGSLFDAVRRARQKRAAAVKSRQEGSTMPHLPFGLDLEVARNYAQQLALAMRYLHNDAGVVHRDVKLENCLIDKIRSDGVGTLSLCDFGMAEYYEDHSELGYDETGNYELSVARPNIPRGTSFASTRRFGPSVTSTNYSAQTPPESEPPSDNSPQDGRVFPNEPIKRTLSSTTNGTTRTSDTTATATITGSVPYAAPELIMAESEMTHPRVDIWAYGVCIYVMIAGRFPFSHAIESILLDKIQAGEVDWECVWNVLGWTSEIENEFLAEEDHDDDDEEDDGPRIGVDQRTAREVVRMLKGCLEKSTERRWTIDQVLECGWFFGLEEDY